jgi:hypothetical protein
LEWDHESLLRQLEKINPSKEPIEEEPEGVLLSSELLNNDEELDQTPVLSETQGK